MTKMIRVENACTSDFEAVVEIWDKGQDGQPDTKVSEMVLGHPTTLFQNYITNTRYLVVKELPTHTRQAATG